MSCNPQYDKLKKVAGCTVVKIYVKRWSCRIFHIKSLIKLIYDKVASVRGYGLISM